MDYISEEEQSPQVVSKRKKSSEHQWTDSDVRDLIYMWQQEECLYNTQNKDYHNSNKRSRAIKKILKSEIIITAIIKIRSKRVSSISCAR